MATKSELQGMVDDAAAVPNDAHTREELAEAVGQALDILNGDADEESDDESELDEDDEEGD